MTLFHLLLVLVFHSSHLPRFVIFLVEAQEPRDDHDSIIDTTVGTFTDPHRGGSCVSPYFWPVSVKVWVAYGMLLFISSILSQCWPLSCFYEMLSLCRFHFYCAICKYFLALLSRFETIHFLLWTKFASFFYMFYFLTLRTQWSDVIAVSFIIVIIIISLQL